MAPPDFVGHAIFDSDPPPFKYHLEGGVPVFEPNMEQFSDFASFIKAVEKYGMETGIVKVIPPKDWLDGLPNLDHLIKNIKIKNPIMQNVSGQGGLFRMQNIEKQKSYDIAQWRSLCEDEGHQPPSRRGEVRFSKNKNKIKDRNKDRSKDKRSVTPDVPSGSGSVSAVPPKKSHWHQDMLDENFDYRFDDSDFTAERCEDLEKSYWKSLTYSAAMYGADMPGSLFDDSVKDWNVPNLDNILNQLSISIPGVNTAYLYCGMWKSTFAWHLEDMDLFSINYIHFGAPKQWYSISQKDHKKFYQLMAEMWPEEYKNCKEFLRHKTFHASPRLLTQRGIQVNKVVHYQREFILTFPYGYHSGFNYGYNVAESVNFANESWIPFGKESRKCMCIDDSVGIDVYQLERHLHGEYTDSELDADSDMDLVNGLPTPPSEGIEPLKLKSKSKTKSKKKSIKKSASGAKRKSEASRSDKQQQQPSKKLKTETVTITKHNDTCALCLRKMQATLEGAAGLIPVTKSADYANRYAHVYCARRIPNAVLDKGLHSVDLSRLCDEGKKLRCIACRHRPGLCIRCVYPNCQRAFHPTCAIGAGAVIIPATDMYKPMCICRFHRSKRVTREGLDNDALTQTWAFSLLPGDPVQCQLASGVVFGGLVQENNRAEETVKVHVIGKVDTDIVEVEWRWIRHPGEDIVGHIINGTVPTTVPTASMVQDSTTENKRVGKIVAHKVAYAGDGHGHSKKEGPKLTKTNRALLKKFAMANIEDDNLNFSADTTSKNTWFYAILKRLVFAGETEIENETNTGTSTKTDARQIYIYNPIASSEMIDIYF